MVQVYNEPRSADLLQKISYQQADIKAGCVRMACDSFVMTSMLQVVNKLLVECQNLLSTGLLQVFRPALYQLSYRANWDW